MGWKERESMERLKEYLRWKLGVDRRIPRYVIRGELQRDKKRGMAGRRARGYEKRLKSGKGNEITRMCWRSGKERQKKGSDQAGRRKGKISLKIEEVERGGEEEEEWFGRVVKAERDIQRRERWERINNSEFNTWYKVIKGKRIPGYLKKGWGKSRWSRRARYRLGNEMREGRYWEGK